MANNKNDFIMSPLRRSAPCDSKRVDQGLRLAVLIEINPIKELASLDRQGRHTSSNRLLHALEVRTPSEELGLKPNLNYETDHKTSYKRLNPVKLRLHQQGTKKPASVDLVGFVVRPGITQGRASAHEPTNGHYLAVLPDGIRPRVRGHNVGPSVI